MSLAGRAAWSWMGLVCWLANASLGLVLAAALLAGPQLADGAWDRGIHVTPAQTAAHAALAAAGFTRHHHVHLERSTPSSVVGDGEAVVQAHGSGIRWGSPFSQTVQPEPQVCIMLTGCALIPAEETQPESLALPPFTPPPEVR